MRKYTLIFLKQFVVMFGFVNGIWKAIGINPKAEFSQLFSQVVDYVGTGDKFQVVFTYMPLIILILSLLAIFFMGGILGIAAVGMAFVAGMFVLVSPLAAYAVLIFAVWLGGRATKKMIRRP